MLQLFKHATKTNPVAVIKSRTNGHSGKAIRSHFDADLPSAAVFCTGSKVAINNRNFMPSWGLHNGACGTAVEIVFANGHNPNRGDMPLYTVVDFPLYTGPVWDKDHPTVSHHSTCLLQLTALSQVRSIVRTHPHRNLCLSKTML